MQEGYLRDHCEAAWKKLGIEVVPEFSGKAVAVERKRLGSRLPTTAS